MERLKVSVNASLLTLPTARSIFQYPARFLIPSLISHHHPFTGDLGCKGDTDQRRVASNGSFCNQESVAIPVVAHGTSIIQSDVFMSPPSLSPFSPRFFFFKFFSLSLSPWLSFLLLELDRVVLPQERVLYLEEGLAGQGEGGKKGGSFSRSCFRKGSRTALYQISKNRYGVCHSCACDPDNCLADLPCHLSV